MGVDDQPALALFGKTSVSIDPNGGVWQGTATTTTVTQVSGSSYSLAEPTRAGYNFAGWAVVDRNFVDPTVGAMPGTLSSLGLALYNDADFSGTGYTVAAYGSATHNRKDDTTNPLESGYSLEVVTTGTGGFKQEIPSAVDQVFYQVMVVKLPAGYNLQADTTGLGTGASSYWYDFTTNTWATGNGNWNSGTGDWKVYIHKAVCGSDGTFDTAGNVYVNGSTTWYVGYCQTYQVYAGTSSDIVSGNPLGTQLYQFGS